MHHVSFSGVCKSDFLNSTDGFGILDEMLNRGSDNDTSTNNENHFDKS
jgi:hypothetical protein